MSDRSDLPLADNDSTRLVPWIMGVMAYLAALTLAAALMLSNVAREWARGLEGTLTVQVAVKEGETEKALEARVLATVRVLLKTPGVEAARPIPLSEVAKMLEPWLGAGARTAELPLPRVIDVKLEPDRRPDLGALAKRLAAAVPGASIESHAQWRNTLLMLFASIELVAVVVMALIAAVALAAIVFTTKSVLAVHWDIVEVLHLIGARDAYIAGQFQRHALKLGLKGSIGGTACALATILMISLLARDLDASLLPPIGLRFWHWVLLAALPLAQSYGAMLTARWTVMRALARNM
jgi:cell division transport system permease protein